MDTTEADEVLDAAHPDVDPELLELFEILQWERAVAEGPEAVALEGFMDI